MYSPVVYPPEFTCTYLYPQMYLRHGWNLYDIAMIVSFMLTFVFWYLSWVDVNSHGMADQPRPMWSQNDPRLIGEAFYASACVMAIVKLTFFMQITSYFGPLQVRYINHCR